MSSTGSGVMARLYCSSVGAAVGCGAGVPRAGASRWTMSCSSRMATPCAPDTSCCTVTNTSVPLRPALMLTLLISDTRRLAHCKGSQKLQTPARPHAPRQADGWQEATAFGVPVRADVGLPLARQEVQPVPQRRQMRWRRSSRVQRGLHEADGRGGDLVDTLLSAADPGVVVFWLVRTHAASP